MWRESDHPRRPAGDNRGGEFTHASGVENEKGKGIQAAPTAGPDDGREIPAYGEPTEGSVEVGAYHYSGQDRQALLSEYYGTGYRGAERDRLNEPGVDPRIRQRIYFYVDEGNGIKPESGVGARAHRVTLRNMYDPQKDGAAVWRRGRNANESETAVVKAGFDGYYVRDFASGQGLAVLLGRHSVPVKPIGPKSDAFNWIAPVFKPSVQMRFPYAGKKP